MSNTPKTNLQKTSKLNAYFLLDTFVIERDENFDVTIERSSPIQAWLEAFESNKYSALFRLGFITKEPWFSPSLEYLHRFSEKLIHEISRQPDLELMREGILIELSEETIYTFKEEVPFTIGMEFVTEQWLLDLWEELFMVFKKEILAYEGSVASYFLQHNGHLNVVGRVFFHLVESKDDKFPFAFMATYSTKPVKSKKAVHTPLKNALTEFDGDEKKLFALIATVTKAAEKSSFISDLLESGELFSPLRLTAEEAYIVLKEINLYEEVGIMCRIPNWWRKRNNSIRVSVKVGEKEPSKLGLEGLMDFAPSISIGEETLSEEELLEFLAMAEGLVQYKGQWVEIDKKKLEAIQKALDTLNNSAQSEGMTLGDAIRLEAKLDALLGQVEEDVEVSIHHGQWLRTLKDRLVQPHKIEAIKLADTFLATLRHYQEIGYYWLNQMEQIGFGACLADDMGLGKTIQMLAFLEYARSKGKGPALLIIPASLIGNWQKEIEKFAPKMPYQIVHRSDIKGNQELNLREGEFLYITTYSMAVRMEELTKRQWNYLILDEAQAIKNPGTKQTKAIKSIPAKLRIAMTGTPIENRLSDLWSLFDFLNQGLLGTTKEFTQFSKGLLEDGSGYAKLRKMIQPFILRRLKTDKSIISDLPDKLEMNSFTSLSKKQIVLYKQLLIEIEKKLNEVDGIERKGLVLASIMKFKQICNHPDQYLGREEFKEEHSGKFEQLREICEVIHDKRERVLIFTQFREMTEPIAEFLKEIFGREGFVLHGGTSVKKRSELVEKFNGESYVPFMVLSLKAGGVGLNLTSANHVIHFDRWWNPAVENQATDRAFRIGQTKNVMVHKFVTQGTIEEKINAIIEEKQKMSSDILSASGEQWITEYSNEELLNMFALGGNL